MPTNVQARIAEIRARFDPASTATTDGSTTSGAGGDFASVLATQLLAGQGDSTLSALGGASADGLATDPSSLVSSAGGLAGVAALSRGALSGSNGVGVVRNARDAASAYGVSGVGGVSTAGPIATKQAVANLERLYENGRLPDEALASIGVGSHRLAPPAASAFIRLRSAAAADGIDIGITDSYRSYDAQVDVARRKGLYSQGGLAAKPGTSDHGLGLAVDLDLDADALAWMRTNAARYGFVEDTPRETWHWKFDGV